MSASVFSFRRVFRVAGPALLLALVLTACGGQQAPSASQGEQQQSDQQKQAVTIKLWHMPNGADPATAMKTELEAFKNMHPEITVETEQLDWSGAFTRIQAAVQGGEGPCITQLGTTWVPGFSAMGGLRPYTAEEVSAMGGPDAFVKASWDSSGIAGSNEVTSIPWFSDVRAIAYQKDFLEKAGLTPEQAFKDWESFENALQKIKQANPGVAPLAYPGKNDWNIWQNSAMWIWTAGGDLLTSDHSQAAINTPEAVKGVTQFASLYGKELTLENTLELNSAQVDGAFSERKVAIVISGPWLISNSRTPAEEGGWENQEARENLAYAEFPAGPGGQYTFVGGSNLSILNTCPHPDAAIELVKFLVSNESQVRYAQNIGMLPANKEAQADPAIANDPHYSVFIKAATKGKSSPAIPEWGQIEPALQDTLGGIWEEVAAAGFGTPISEATVKARLDTGAQAINTLVTK